MKQDDGFEQFPINKEIIRALNKLGYNAPTEVQRRVIPLALAECDIIAQSQTGSGKTAAFAIPLVERIDIEERHPQALVLVPTRELTFQIKNEISYIGRFRKIRCAAIIGRQPVDMQIKELKQRVHVVAGTPGRTLDLIQRGAFAVDHIQYLIIDEADRMLDMGFLEQVEAIIDTLPVKRTTMLFSATIPEQIGRICEKHMSNPVKIAIEAEEPVRDKITQYYYQVRESEKLALLKKIILTQKPESCIIFCNTREKTEELAVGMKAGRHSCAVLHGGLEQGKRLRSIHGFKQGECRFLLATDVAARGIHIDAVSHVINYDIPEKAENYVHRIGRTGRAGHEGIAISLVGQFDMSLLRDIEAFIGYELEEKEIPVVTADEQQADIMRGADGLSVPLRRLKKDKREIVDSDITRIRINAGRKDKLRPADVMGAITSIEEIAGDDVGIIDIQATCTYVDIHGSKGDFVYNALQEKHIKGKKRTVKRVRIRNI